MELQSLLAAAFEPAAEVGDVVRTGLDELDRLHPVLVAGTVQVVAGAPGVGVTALLLRVIADIAGVQRRPVIFASGDEGGAALARRLLALHARVDASRLRSGTLTEPERLRIEDATGTLQGWPVTLLDPSPDLEHRLRRAVRVAVRKREPIGVIVIDDPFGRATDEPPARARWVEVAADLATEHRVPVVVAAAATPAESDGRDLLTPAAYSRLEGWAAMQRHVDAVWMLYRAEQFDPNSADLGIGELHLLSNRIGLPHAHLRLAFLAHVASWAPLTPPARRQRAPRSGKRHPC